MRRLLFLLALFPMTATAHELAAPGAMPGWTWDGWIVGPLILLLALFLTGWSVLRARMGKGAHMLDWGGWLFLAGWLILAGALMSPLHQLGERSFAAHMVEHELLMLAAAPLLVLARPLVPMLWAFPGPARRWLGRAGRSALVLPLWKGVTGPLPATLLQAAALWLWHAPALFDRALASSAWHATQHLCFLVAGLIFWTAMLARSTPRGVAALCLFATSLVSGALGALMAFALSPWYPRYAALGMAPFGLSPVEDQQLAGLLMWVPGGLIHAGAALLLLHGMVRQEESIAHAG